MGSERERRRVAVLREYHLLDTPPAAELEAVVRVAATVAGVPTATLNLLDDARQYQLTTVGFAGQQCSRADSMCAVRLDRGAFVHLPDAREEPDYRDNPWVTGRLGRIVFYASAPLISPGGLVMGTLCVFDERPRELSREQIRGLEDLAGIVVAFFERRRLARLSAVLRETIQARDQWTRTMLDSIDEAVIATSPAGVVTLFNRAAQSLHPDADLGAGPDGSAARYRLFEPDGRTPIPDEEVPLVVAMREGVPVKGRELVIRVPGREPRSVLANAAPLRDADGRISGAVVALHDVTAEHTRRRILEEAHQRLAAANTELRRSNADLTNFAGAVSHDLVAPLAAVGGYLELLADPDETAGHPRVAGWVTSAAQAVARMRDLIDALLGYARAGSAPVRTLVVPLDGVIGEVLHDLGPQIAAAGTRVVAPGPLPEVVGDPVLIRQLLQNLIGNAVKFRDPGRPSRVEITADGPSLRIADNGVGIPPSRREEVFDMFARVDGQVARRHGIGLSSCLRIVERHGGTITIGDTPGGGTTVTVTLPEKGSDRR
ncbi:sensor histidine kinase [Actinoplanes philippinensis]|uniref:sensor histidine kinase n=1 Tax=Actinoplanes philippinensis TaxID=35752 RepID=UPI0033C3C2A3